MRTALNVTLLPMLLCATAAQNHPSSSPASPPAVSQTPPPSVALATPLANWPTAQFAAPAAKDPSVQKAKQILDDMIRALGGDAYLNLREMSVEGRNYSFYHGRPSGLGVLFWRFWQWPDKDRIEITKQRDIIDLFVGDKGYETTYKGTVTIDPKQLTDYLRRRDHSLEVVVRSWLPAQGTMILYEGTVLVEQNLADKVTVLNASNDSVTIAVDPRTHLPVRKTYSYRDPIDRQFDDEAEIFSNYKTVQGIATPYSTVRMENGEMSNQRFITTVSYNNGFDGSMFQPKGLLYNQPKAEVPKPQ
jgi:hypothetical protein